MEVGSKSRGALPSGSTHYVSLDSQEESSGMNHASTLATLELADASNVLYKRFQGISVLRLGLDSDRMVS
jgi:hypothetical protein